jgi:hypothetical protein
MVLGLLNWCSREEKREHPNYVNVNLSWGSSRKLSEAGGETFAIFNAAWCESISAIQGMLPEKMASPPCYKLVGNPNRDFEGDRYVHFPT